MSHTHSFDTLLVHAGEAPDKETGALAPVLARTKTYAQKEFGVEGEFQYSRGKNPTRERLLEKLSALEGGGHATVFSSGIAATAAFFMTLSPGDHILCCHEVYGGTFRLLDQLLSRFGIQFDFVDFTDENEILENIRPHTKYLFLESPTNPSLHIIDLKLIKKISRETGIPYAVDATFAPPCTTRHFEYGAKVIIHSLSKYIAGHNDVIAGGVITTDKKLHEQLFFMNRTLGAILSPDECYRILQEVKTLSLRWDKVSKSAQTVAEFLEHHPAIKRVNYPGLDSHPGHETAKAQMKNGYGGVVSFQLHARSFNELKLFVNTARKHAPITYGESLASPETILAYPPLMSHRSLPLNVRESLGIKDGFFRLSLGFEDVNEIIAGLSKGLEAICKPK